MCEVTEVPSNVSSCPSINVIVGTAGVQFRNEQFLARSRKTRVCAETYDSTSHNETRSLTPILRKRAIYGWKLVHLQLFRLVRVWTCIMMSLSAESSAELGCIQIVFEFFFTTDGDDVYTLAEVLETLHRFGKDFDAGLLLVRGLGQFLDHPVRDQA